MMIHWWVRKPSRGPNNCMFWAMTEAKGEVGIPQIRFKPPSILILTIPRRYFCYGSLLLLVLALISSQSLNLGGRRGTTDDVATISFHPSLSSTALRNLQTPFPSIPWCYLPISSSVFLSFLLLSLSPAESFSPCQGFLRCGHTIWVSVSLPWLGDHHALQLHSGFCCEPPRSSHGLCRTCSEVSYSI